MQRLLQRRKGMLGTCCTEPGCSRRRRRPRRISRLAGEGSHLCVLVNSVSRCVGGGPLPSAQHDCADGRMRMHHFGRKVSKLLVPETYTRPFPDEPKEMSRSTGEDGYYCCTVFRGHAPNSDPRTPFRLGEARHRCRFCPYSHSQRVHLARHEVQHTGEKPFWCDMCGKAFTRSSYLTVHQRLHTGERPYTCDTCGKSFVGSSSMLAHKKLQACRLYKCRHCSRAFAREETLIVHSLCHNQGNS